MKGMMIGFLMVLLAGISFAAVYSDSYMERTYQLQLCKINQAEGTLLLAILYNPTSAQIEQIYNYAATWENDKKALASAKSRNDLKYLLRNSNLNIQKANSLYYKMYYPFMRTADREAKAFALSERKYANEFYSLCRICVIRPTDSRCPQEPQSTSGVCYVEEGSEKAAISVFIDGYMPGWLLFPTEAGDFEETISGEMFPAFKDRAISNYRLNKKYVEQQTLSFSGTTSYDPEISGVIEKISHDFVLDSVYGYGLPLCPGDESVQLSECRGEDRLESQRVFISFLGEDWVISEISNVEGAVPADVGDAEPYEIDGATVRLAKEEKYGIISMGENMKISDEYTVVLEDVSFQKNVQNSHPALFSVLDANGNPICKEQVDPGETVQDFCGTGIRLHLYQAAPGFTAIARWAEIAVYSEEALLVSGGNLFNTDWKTHLYWTTRGGASAGDSPENLKQISIDNGDTPFEIQDGDPIVIPAEDGRELLSLGLSPDPNGNEYAYWTLAFPPQVTEKMREYTLHEGEEVRVGSTEMGFKIVSIDQQLDPRPNCPVHEGSETVTVQISSPGGSLREYTLHEGENAYWAETGVNVAVLDISAVSYGNP